VAIVPIGRNDVRWLIVLDKVAPSRMGFSLRDREHLETCKSSTERSLLHLSEEIVEVNHRTLQRALSEYAHLFRNPLTVIGGFAKKLNRPDPRGSNLLRDHLPPVLRLEEDFCSFMALVAFSSRPAPGVRDCLDRYLRRSIGPSVPGDRSLETRQATRGAAGSFGEFRNTSGSSGTGDQTR
jgi:signal transduction histidine kinase